MINKTNNKNIKSFAFSITPIDKQYTFHYIVMSKQEYSGNKMKNTILNPKDTSFLVAAVRIRTLTFAQRKSHLNSRIVDA